MTGLDARLLLRPSEAANALGISRAKAYELIAAKDLPSVRLGGSIRVPVEALRVWIELHTCQQAPAASPRTEPA